MIVDTLVCLLYKERSNIHQDGDIDSDPIPARSMERGHTWQENERCYGPSRFQIPDARAGTVHYATATRC